MSVAPKTLTADELLAMPPDGLRYELVQGELREMTPAGYNHGLVVAELTWRLGQHVSAHHLGQVLGAETGFVLARAPDTVRAPDIAFVGRDRAVALGRPQGYADAVPDLAVEVVSPGDRQSEVNEKVLAWLSAGCRAVWTVDPMLKTVTIYHSPTDIRVCTADQELADDAVLTGFRCKVADLFGQ